MLKWERKTQVYMWAWYFSSDGKWKAFDRDIQSKSSRKFYNPITRQFEHKTTYAHVWKLENLVTNEVLHNNFKTLAEAKKFAEEYKD